MALVSEPRLVVLRERLAAEREQGTDFPSAWELARAELLNGISAGWERGLWSSVLASTAWAWETAYEGRSSRLWVVLAELEAYAADGELEPLSYSPVA